MSNETKALAPMESIKASIQGLDFKQQMAAVLPPHISADRMARIAITAMMGKREIIEAWAVQAGKASIFRSLLQCAQWGIEPDGRMAHLLPYWSSTEKCYIIQLILDYKGLVALAKRNGVDAKAMLVHENDEFEYIEDDGTGRTVVRHNFDPFKDRGAIIGVYSRAIESAKQPDYELMSITEVEGIRARSRAKDSGPWKTDYGEMVKKSVLRRHSKRWDLDPNFRDALAEDFDTPPPLVETRVVEPKFKELPPTEPVTKETPQPKAWEKGRKRTAKPVPEREPEGDVVVDPDEMLQKKPAEAPKEEKVEDTVALRVRRLCKDNEVDEQKFLETMAMFGTISPGCLSLEAAYLDNPAGMEMIEKQFKDIIARM